MLKRIQATLLLLALVTGVFAAGKQTTDKKQDEIVIAAAASLKDAMSDLIVLYSKTEPTVTVTATYGSSGSLQKQIEQGAPVDVFFSASPKQMKALEDQGLILVGTRKDLLRNSLVLITPMDKKGITSFADAGTNKIRQLATGEPTSVPAGQYAEQVFSALGIADAVKAKSVYAKDVRQVLTYVESGEVDAGVVYATDAAISKTVRIAATAPVGTHDPVIYPAALIKTSANPQAAKKFLLWLSGPEASAVFVRYGFLLP